MDISFPKFKLEQKYKMKKLLYALGIKTLFARTADLSHLTDQKHLTVSQVSLLKLFAIWIIVTEGPCSMSHRPTIGKEPIRERT